VFRAPARRNFKAELLVALGLIAFHFLKRIEAEVATLSDVVLGSDT
jgi:hypothetical protein